MKRLLLFALAGPALATAAVALEPLEQGGVASLGPFGAHRVWVTDRICAPQRALRRGHGQGARHASTPVRHRDAEAADARPPPRRDLLGRHGVLARRPRRARRLRHDLRRRHPRGERRDPAPDAHGREHASLGYAALLDGERFLAAFNQFPSTSVSIVDVETRRFVDEIVIDGCAGDLPRRRAQLRDALRRRHGDRGARSTTRAGRRAAHGAPLLRPGRGSGHRGRRARSGSALAVRARSRASAHEVDFSREEPPARGAALVAASPTTSARARGASAGSSTSRCTGAAERLYSLVHQGGRGPHKDCRARGLGLRPREAERVDASRCPNLVAGVRRRPSLGVAAGGCCRRMLSAVIPNHGAHTIAVTQDAAPLLFVRNAEVGVVAVARRAQRRAAARPRRGGHRRADPGSPTDAVDPVVAWAARGSRSRACSRAAALHKLARPRRVRGGARRLSAAARRARAGARPHSPRAELALAAARRAGALSARRAAFAARAALLALYSARDRHQPRARTRARSTAAARPGRPPAALAPGCWRATRCSSPPRWPSPRCRQRARACVGWTPVTVAGGVAALALVWTRRRTRLGAPRPGARGLGRSRDRRRCSISNALLWIAGGGARRRRGRARAPDRRAARARRAGRRAR